MRGCHLDCVFLRDPAECAALSEAAVLTHARRYDRDGSELPLLRTTPLAGRCEDLRESRHLQDLRSVLRGGLARAREPSCLPALREYRESGTFQLLQLLATLCF